MIVSGALFTKFEYMGTTALRAHSSFVSTASDQVVESDIFFFINVWKSRIFQAVNANDSSLHRKPKRHRNRKNQSSTMLAVLNRYDFMTLIVILDLK